MNEKPKFRHELKYQIDFFQRQVLRQRLRTIMKSDAHTGEDGTYLITSLYFDNADDKAMREKRYGVSHREKFRIRYYNEDFRFMKLEKKEKHHGLCLKYSAPISVEQCRRLLEGRRDWAGEDPQPLLTELNQKMKCQGLRPKTLVTYRREPLVYAPGNVRVTFDSDIRTGLWSTGLLDLNRVEIGIGDPSKMILEVKYDGFLPEVAADLLQLGTTRVQAFSKYADSRVYE